jgi:probable F420-dependent oxidoreductase
LVGLGVTLPLQASLGDVAQLRKLEDSGYAEFWSAETARVDAFAPLLAAAPAVSGRLGTAIASVFARGPALLAMQAAALCEMAPGRVAIGIGSSSRVMTESWNDRAYERPLARVRDTVRFLREALSGSRVSSEYETFRVRGFQLDRAPTTPPPVLVAALREKMLDLAREEADGVVLNWCSADDVSQVARHLARTPRADRQIVARIFVVPSEDAEQVRGAARPFMTRYLGVPAYAAYHEWLGRGEALKAMHSCMAERDFAGAADAIPDHVVDELIVHGSPARCAEHLAEYVAAGVTSPVVKILPLLPDRAELADAVAVAAAFSAI